ncbi:hypothetical protein CKM354_000820200 [Cercospora kikuchii]|uniref:Uncharacterized protein n=1 Tax=Cercospora kikuchii TaxID=84275 RepID=A0A9P3FF19_9PEZI|nr:uncharacterized protein CKM354_000820200 [Cercospora kikuchii]GIZ45018.1 hypothetical protein CKM354_000820200 [Cercospora kikuchii]
MNAASTDGSSISPDAATEARRDSKDPAHCNDTSSIDKKRSQATDMSSEPYITPTTPVTDRDAGISSSRSSTEVSVSGSEAAASNPAMLWESVDPEFSDVVPAAGKGLPLRLSSLYTYRSFGHPHATPHHSVNASYAEPFWHQFPKWATPGNRLRYDPSLDKFSYHLSSSTSCSYNGISSWTCPVTRPMEGIPGYRESKEPVDVYLGETFVQKVPLRLLLRFSTVARRLFKLQGPRAQDTSYHNFEPSLSKLRNTPSSNSECRRSLRTGTPKSNTPKQIILDLDAPRLPSIKAIQSIIEWMQIVEPTPSGTRLPAFAPGNFSQMQTSDLIDLYQAIMLFEIRPRPVWQNLFDELKHRIIQKKPTVALLTHLRLSLPISDPILTHALRAVMKYRNQGAYLSGGGWEAMRDFLFASGDDVLGAKAEEILARYDNDYGRMLAERETSGCDNEDAQQMTKCEESDDRSSNAIPIRRRRNRRAQQSRGRVEEAGSESSVQ